MKPIPLVLGGVAGLAALWSVGWYAGKVLYVEPEADAVVERLRDGALFFAYDSRRVGGFPFGYEATYEGVSLSDASASWRWSASEMTVASGVADAGALVLRPSRESRLEVAAPALGGAEGDAPSIFDVASDDLALRLSETAEGTAIALDAAAVTATQAEAAGVLSGAEISLTAPDIDAALSPGGTEATATADTLVLAWRLSVDGVTEDVGRSESRGVAISFSADGEWSGDVASFVAGGGATSISFSSSGYEASAESAGDPTTPDMKMSMMGGPNSGVVELGEGRAVYRATAEGMSYDVELGAGGPFPGGAMAVADASINIETPLLRTEGAEPFAISLALSGMTADEGFWALADPAGAIERTPLDLTVDLGGAARLFFDVGADAAGAPPPEVETLEIKEIALKGLGVDARASGALDVAGDASRPDGEVLVEVEGAFGLLEKLVAAGITPAEQADVFRQIAAAYGLEAGAEDRIEAKIAARNGAISLNGLPLQ
ncbi:MAG: DUF2125 domain-containing protein [Pseudomonadota bacterium]